MIAATSTDEVNIICCLLAKKLGARHTIARIRNPEYNNTVRLIKDELGLSMSINPEQAAAREILRAIRFSNSIKVSSFAKGRIELAEVKVTENSPLLNMRVVDINQYTFLDFFSRQRNQIIKKCIDSATLSIHCHTFLAI